MGRSNERGERSVSKSRVGEDVIEKAFEGVVEVVEKVFEGSEDVIECIFDDECVALREEVRVEIERARGL